jgi:hypothetical protein
MSSQTILCQQIEQMKQILTLPFKNLLTPLNLLTMTQDVRAIKSAVYAIATSTTPRTVVVKTTT